MIAGSPSCRHRGGTACGSRGSIVAGILLGLLAFTAGGPAEPLPEEARTLQTEGQEALREGDHPRAATAFEAATALAPDSADLFFDLGIARSSMQDWAGALAAYRRVLELDPGNARAHNNIGNVQLRRGEYEEAAASYRRAVELEPDYLLSLYHLGWVARQLSRHEEAERAFSRCLELTATRPRERQLQEDARFYLGALRFRARDFPAAAALMEQVLSVRPNHLEAHYYVGQAYLRTGRTDEARRHLEIHKQLIDSRRTTEPVASGGIR